MKKCPYCAEMIQPEAVKCRFCNSALYGTAGVGKAKANQHPSYWIYTLVAILLPLVGFILGIIGLTKSDPVEKKLGEHALALSVVFFVIYLILFPFIGVVFAATK